MNNTGKAVSKQNSKWDNTLKTLNRQKLLFVLIAPAIILTIIFSYVPMVGIKMAFQDYNIYMPEASEWIGFKNFIDIFTIKEFTDGIKNTVIISLLNLLICFPAGIVFVLLLNEIKNTVYKKVIQTVSYLPHFLSWISVIGIVTSLFSEYGIINDLLVTLTGGAHERTMYLAEQWFFIPNVIILSLWKGVGWGSIVFLAAITGIDQSLYEAAKVDGASRLRQVWSITIPGILPTIMIMLLWQLATIALWVMVAHWNDWTATLYYVTKSSLFTLQYIMMQLIKESERIQKLQEAAIMAGMSVDEIQVKTSSESLIAAQVIVSTVPIICVYPFLQKYFVKGIMMGSVKG